MTAPAPERPQLYLISPPAFDARSFAETLARLLDRFETACFRLDLAGSDADAIRRAADLLRETCHARDVAIVIASHFRLAAELGLDGVHLKDGVRGLREARRALGAEAIVGAHCGASRHAGITAAEAGADYIAFGPVADSGLGDGSFAGRELFAWWSEMIEVPVVAEGGLSPETAADLAPVADFLAPGGEIWTQADPEAALAALLARL